MTLDDIIRTAREAGYGDAMADLHAPALERFAALVAIAEREACIRILSRTEFTSLDHMPSEAALIIRARGGA